MGNSNLQSSLTKKYVMAIAGLFLITFLFVHLGINLLVLLPDTSWFNIAAHFMGTNILIKIFEIVLFGGFIIHIIYGLILQIQNWMARPNRYKVEGWSHKSPFSKFMIHTAAIIFIFLVIHLIDFYFKAKFGHIADVMIDGEHYHDLATLVLAKFKLIGFVIGYIVALVILGFHLHHGFQSAFQSLGLNHKTYTPIINVVGNLVALILVGGYILIPLVIYFGNY
jgi:succinate dehydrogenase / fumarate reductase cytochrome b subunit